MKLAGAALGTIRRRARPVSAGMATTPSCRLSGGATAKARQTMPIPFGRNAVVQRPMVPHMLTTPVMMLCKGIEPGKRHGYAGGLSPRDALADEGEPVVEISATWAHICVRKVLLGLRTVTVWCACLVPPGVGAEEATLPKSPDIFDLSAKHLAPAPPVCAVLPKRSRDGADTHIGELHQGVVLRI